ncbi:hypothetical protein QE152_g4042 [Popillia japonica]|uniref:SMP-LTD domain-containing protein n=1 Tax=Popillia japonica TaxID=7064 RepID=A0AAW1N1Z7_POPJA
MDLSNKGKSLTTSVPSMAIRFNATAEEIEEVFTKEEDRLDDAVTESIGTVLPTEKNTDIETSPRRSILPLLGKRSISADVNSTSAQDSSPPSDPWRFLSDIKGKITKSVEVKFTEYKTRTMENEGSPKITNKDKAKDSNSKENSSLSDSEEASESSISKTCGVVSTTEGVEMSSDDDTPSLSEEDKQQHQQQPNRMESQPFTVNSKDITYSSSNTNVRQRFRVTSQKSSSPLKEGSFSSEFLENIQKIGKCPSATRRTDVINDEEAIESGVDALADLNISNFRIDSDNVLNIDEVSGTDIRNAEFGRDGFYDDLETVYAPSGFVDLRRSESSHMNWYQFGYKNKPLWLTVLCLTFYFYLPLSLYVSGFIAGGLVVSVVWCIYIKLHYDPIELKPSGITVQSFVEIPSVKEHQPLKKYEGWMNEYPEEYNPLTYHVSQTQAVYLRLQGNFLKVSHTRQKIPKRAMWNEPDYKQVFTRHRIYNLQGAKVMLLPDGLARVRQWSKKYPICIVLSKDQMNLEGPLPVVKRRDLPERDVSGVHEKKPESIQEIDNGATIEHENNNKQSVRCIQSSESVLKNDITQIFSKLVDNIDDMDPPQIATGGSSNGLWSQRTESNETFNADLISNRSDLTEIMGFQEEEDDDVSIYTEEWHDVAGPMQINPDDTRLYLFSRTCRDKEDWFRRLRLAARQNGDDDDDNNKRTLDDEYISYMRMQNVFFTNDRQEQDHQQQRIPHHLYSNDNVWVNAIIARVIFDCAREETITQRIKERIQRKLASIRLPYFIQELYCEELNLGSTTPIIKDSSTPTLDERGLWIDLDVSYEGLIVVILQTKVNLMKLKTVHISDKQSEKVIDDKPAIFHSDVDDSAESSTDDEPAKQVPINYQSVLDSKGNPVPGLGGSSKGSKKLMKMVDKIAESKFFQAATENKYIKRAMQEFSNTNLRLKVELKKCIGQLAINIPPPPSDRIWIGFRMPPELVLSAHPIVGDRSIGFMRVTSWIEKKIYKEFQKIFVIPNMEDLLIPVMSPKLPQ